MRRGEILIADESRPVVVVSNDAANRRAETLGRGVVTVVPLTSNVTRVLPFQVLVEAGSAGLTRASKVQAEQVRSIAVERLGARIGRLGPETMQEVDRALRLHLTL